MDEFYIRYTNPDGSHGLGNFHTTQSYINHWTRCGYTFFDANTGEEIPATGAQKKPVSPPHTPTKPTKGFAAFARSKL